MSRKNKRIINKVNVILNTPKGEKETTWKRIKGNLPALTFLLALLTFGFFIYDRYYKEDKVETIKKEILSTIYDIEKSIEPNTFINSPDSLFIKEYQQTVATACAQWRSLEGNNQFSDLKSRSDQEKMTIAYDYLSRWKDHHLTKISILAGLIILNSKYDNNLGLDYAKVLSMKEQEMNSKEARDKYYTAIKKHILSKNADGVLKELDKLRNNLKCLAFDKEFFVFIEEANKLINAAI